MIAPPCPHYGTCGGCQLQHLPDNVVAIRKTQAVLEPLAKHGITPSKVYPIQTSPARARRRATLTSDVQNGDIHLGFFTKSSHILTNIETCIVVTSAIEEAFPLLKKIAVLHDAPLRFHVTDTPKGLDVQVSGIPTPDYKLLETLQALCATADIPLARMSLGDLPIWQCHTPSFTTQRVTPPPGAFLQATRHGEALMTGFIKHHFHSMGAIIDLFCGCGTLCLPLYSQTQITAFDSNEAQIAALAQATCTSHLAAIQRNLFRNPITDFGSYDGIIIDPPRAGAKAQTQAIAANATCPVIFASCNPQTFARDANILCAAGYQLRELLPIDQFRWSEHVEMIGLFLKDT